MQQKYILFFEKSRGTFKKNWEFFFTKANGF